MMTRSVETIAPELFQKLTDQFLPFSEDKIQYKANKKTTASIHWQEFCKFPRSSVTPKTNGECAQCVEDSNNEIVLGDARTQSLYDIWNSDANNSFPEDHFNLKPEIMCTEQCDMHLIGSDLAQ